MKKKNGFDDRFKLKIPLNPILRCVYNVHTRVTDDVHIMVRYILYRYYN